MLGALKDTGATPLHWLELGAAGSAVRLPMPEGIGVSRARLDVLMSDAVCAAGGTFVQGTKASLGPIDGHFRTVPVQSGSAEALLKARMVLAADGLHGSVLRGSGHAPQVAAGARLGAGTLLPPGTMALAPGVIRMAVASGGYVGAALVEDGQIDVAAAFDPVFLRTCGGPADAANAVLSAAGYAPISLSKNIKWEGTPPLTRRASVLGAERVLVLGDAAGYIEPFTGEGMAWALTSGYVAAPLVAKAVENYDGTLVKRWESAYRAHVTSRQVVCRGIAGLVRHPLMTRALLQVLRWRPQLAQPLMRYVNAPALLTL